MKNLDTIDVEFRSNEDDGDYAVLVLNGVDVPQPFNLMYFIAAGGMKHVEIEILTCSCGNAGCAGIFYGTRVKRRRRTVEWRDIDCGLPKRFYAFDRVEYDIVTQKTLARLLDIVEQREGFDPELYDFSGQLCYESVRQVEFGIEYRQQYMKKYCSK